MATYATGVCVVLLVYVFIEFDAVTVAQIPPAFVMLCDPGAWGCMYVVIVSVMSRINKITLVDNEGGKKKLLGIKGFSWSTKVDTLAIYK